MKLIDLHIHLADSNMQLCLDDCDCDFISSGEISLRLACKRNCDQLHYEVPQAATFLAKLRTKQVNICIAVEILIIEMYMQALKTFSMLTHQSNSINPLASLLDLL